MIFHGASRSGQSLIELLIAIGVGVILIGGGIAVFAPSIRSHGTDLRIQAASALGKELMENVTVFGEGNWHNIDNLTASSSVKYYLIASSSPFTIATGTESIAVATTTYTRYFYLGDVYRNGSGKIDASGSTLDPSTKQITVVYGWGNGTSSLASYLARTADSVFTQTDWSLGSGQAGPITATSTNAQFASSTNIDYSTSTGSIVITGF